MAKKITKAERRRIAAERHRIAEAERRRIANEYRDCIAALGLSQLAAAKFLGISPRQSRRLALGEVAPDVRTEMLLSAMLKYDISVDDMNKLINKRKDLKK
jgi:transcriptional regulator with XRE-family HTH domain